MKNKVVKAQATYTGGGIYAYTGKLSSGEYFVCADDFSADILNTDFYSDHEPFYDDSSFEEKHKIRTASENETYSILSQIFNNGIPENMSKYDYEKRLEKIHSKTWF